MISFKTLLYKVIWTVKDYNLCGYFYGLIKKQMFHNTSFLSLFYLKSVYHYCVCYDEYLGRTYQNFKKIDLGSYFGLEIKNHFYRNVPHLVMLG